MRVRVDVPDSFAHIREATDDHRRQHACGAFPYGNAALLGTLAAATNARRILELGTALGYSALSFAQGAPDAVIDTIEADNEHVRLAREHVETAGLSGHIVVHHGEFAHVLRRLDPGYDLAFFDGFTPTLPLLRTIRGLLRTGGLLISANLTHEGGERYRDALQDDDEWLTSFIGKERETALSVKL
jgi:predicted O-methyltransferase YrrM